jgi:hypothetical protein
MKLCALIEVYCRFGGKLSPPTLESMRKSDKKLAGSEQKLESDQRRLVYLDPKLFEITGAAKICFSM